MKVKSDKILIRRATITGLMTIVVCASAWAYQTASKLIINGAVASSDIRTIGGVAYVPVKDVAKALNLTVVAKAGSIELTKEGGANQLSTSNSGKMGTEVFTGKWRFSVTGVERAATYKKTLTPGFKKEVEAKSGDELVIVKCRVKNGTPKKDSLVYDKWDGSNTAITDNEGHSYEPVLWDVREDQSAPDGAAFLPGAAVDFILVFDVPKGMELKDLIFTAIRYDTRASFDQKKYPPTDIRYSLVK